MRPSKRALDALRAVQFTHQFTKHAEGSVLVCFGETKVLCTASVESGVPRFLKDEKPKQGWLTAEYGMLPRSTHDRMNRESVRGKQSGRTQEIQRLIGRALRSVVDLTLIPDYTIHLDCDVIQADGGTRTAAITGAFRALEDAIKGLHMKGVLPKDVQPIQARVAAVSVGIYEGEVILDLDYAEDSVAETDMNIVMTDQGGIIEVQGTAEKSPFTETQFAAMMAMAKKGIHELLS